MKKDLNNPNYLEYVSHQKSNAVNTYALPEYHEWPEEYKEAFEKIAGPQMASYGYTT